MGSSVAEVAEAGIAGVGRPGQATFIGEIVVGDLLGRYDESLLLGGGAGEKALIDQGVLAGGFGDVGGIGLNRKFKVGVPEAGGFGDVEGVDGRGVAGFAVVRLFVAACEDCCSCCAGEGRCDCFLLYDSSRPGFPKNGMLEESMWLADGLEPALGACDAGGVDAVGGAELCDGLGEIVAHGAFGEAKV